jgi:hypothetical protein
MKREAEDRPDAGPAKRSPLLPPEMTKEQRQGIALKKKAAISKRDQLDAIKSLDGVHPALRQARHHSVKRDLGGGYEQEPDHDLTDEQLQVLQSYVLAGQNVCLVGHPGTGKSFVLRRIVALLPKESTFVAAHTQESAANVSGVTISSLAGGLWEPKTADDVADRIVEKAKVVWCQMKYLIIDESSGLSAMILEGLEKGAKRARDSDEFFGGIHVLLVGDPGQIGAGSYGKSSQLFFDCPWFHDKFKLQLQLTNSFRQTNSDFRGVLNEVRNGKVSAATESVLNARYCQHVLCSENNPERFNGCQCLGCTDGVQATAFVSTHGEVKNLNLAGLKTCRATGALVQEFRSADRTDYCNPPGQEPLHAEPWKLLDHCDKGNGNVRGVRMERQLDLAEGAQVWWQWWHTTPVLSVLTCVGALLQVVLCESISAKLKKGDFGAALKSIPSCCNRVLWIRCRLPWDNSRVDACAAHSRGRQSRGNMGGSS